MVVVDGDELKRKGIVLEPSLLNIPMCCGKYGEEEIDAIRFVFFCNLDTQTGYGQFVDVDVSQIPPLFTRTLNSVHSYLYHVAPAYQKNLYSQTNWNAPPGGANAVEMTFPPGRVVTLTDIPMGTPAHTMWFPAQPDIDGIKVWYTGSDDDYAYLINYNPQTLTSQKQALPGGAYYWFHIAVDYGVTLVPNGGIGKKVYLTAPAETVILEFDIDTFPSAPTLHIPPATGMNYCVIDINGNFWSVTKTDFWKCANSDLGNPAAWTSFPFTGDPVDLMGFDTDTAGNIWLLGVQSGKSYIFKCTQTGTITKWETPAFCNYPGVGSVPYEYYNLLRVNKQPINVGGAYFNNLVFFLVSSAGGAVATTTELDFFNPSDTSFTQYVLTTDFVKRCFSTNIAFEQV